MGSEILELAVVLTLAAVFGMIAKLLRQPLVLAYLATGLVLGLFGLTPFAAGGSYRLFSDLGVMFLLFLVGLEINLASLRYIGPIAGLIALGQVVITFAGGFTLALLLSTSLVSAAYIGLTLALSSTIVVVKLISEKQDLNSLYGKLSIGILVFQDVMVMVVLLMLTGWQEGVGFEPAAVVGTLVKGVGLVAVMAMLGRWVMPKVFSRVAHSSELIFVASLAWVFLVVAIVKGLGLSIEVGGFLAGLALANASEHFHIAHRVKPLRDFFLVLFFVVLGTTAAQTSLVNIGWLVVSLSIFVLVAKPLIVWGLMTALGYHRRTAFLTGLTMGQVSEFSLVLAAVGIRLGQIDQSLATTLTVVMVMTITLSSFGILHSEQLYRLCQPLLKLFERRHRRREDTSTTQVRRSIILIGAHRTGQHVLTHLPKGQVAVIDFDPDIVQHLRQRGWLALYGDVNDPDLFDPFDLTKVKMIISTSPSFGDNMAVITRLRKQKRVIIIVRAENEPEARRLYHLGADYVLLPQLTAGEYLGHLVTSIRAGRSVISRSRRRDLQNLAHEHT